MINDESTESPEEHLSKDLMRVSAELQRGVQADHSLVELFEVLLHYSRETDCDPQTLNEQVRRFSDPANASLENQRRSFLVAMLQDTHAQLRCRMLNVAERLEALDTTRKANASYGGVAHWEHVSQTPHAFRYQS